MLLQVRQGCDFEQGGKQYRAGDLVDVPDHFVPVLTLPGGRLEQPGAPAAGAGQLQRRDLEAGDKDQAPLAQAGQAPGSSRRRLNRRDMQAKD